QRSTLNTQRSIQIVGRWALEVGRWRFPSLVRQVQSLSRYSSVAFVLATLGAQASSPNIWEEFSGEKAFAHVQQLVEFGPRPPGSKTIEKSRVYIDDQLRRSGWQVTRQAFTDDTPQGKIQFVNLIARFPGQRNTSSSLFLLCSHYDTKIF